MNENSTHFDVIIIGSGPAGYTAAIYTGRANIKTLVLEGIERGGQLMITTDLENFPGFPDAIMGPDFMELMRKQAQKFGSTLLSVLAEEVQLQGAKPFKVKADGKFYTSDSIIIATGATARFMGIPSEKEYKGRGVSACATCDGFFFKNKHVIVVGGGDSAMEEANFLTKFASKVTIVHRRDGFRASPIMMDRVKNNPKIEILTFKVIDEIFGDPATGTVARVNLKDVRDNAITEFPVQGVFVAVGHDPNTSLFAGQLKMDDKKYLITTPGKTETEIPGVFAAGDVQDPYYRQAITAAGSGCMAALEAEKYLESIH